MLDRTRLAKLLALTASDNDAEALSAIRKANEIIKGNDLQWLDVVSPAGNTLNITLQRQPMTASPVDGDDKDWQPPHLTDATIIDPMFRAVFAQPRTDNEEFWTFLESLHHQWETKHRLTPNQYSALRRCFNRTVTKRA